MHVWTIIIFAYTIYALDYYYSFVNHVPLPYNSARSPGSYFSPIFCSRQGLALISTRCPPGLSHSFTVLESHHTNSIFRWDWEFHSLTIKKNRDTGCLLYKKNKSSSQSPEDNDKSNIEKMHVEEKVLKSTGYLSGIRISYSKAVVRKNVKVCL